MTKVGKIRAGANVGFMFTAFSYRRIRHLISPNVIKEYLRTLCLPIFTKFGSLRRFLMFIKPRTFTISSNRFFLNPIIVFVKSHELNPKLFVSLILRQTAFRKNMGCNK